MKYTEFVAIQKDRFLLAAGMTPKSDCHPLAVAANNGQWNQQMHWETAEAAQAEPLIRIAFALGAQHLIDRGNTAALENINRVVAQGLTTSDFSSHLGEIMRVSAVEGLSQRRDEVKIAGVIPAPNFKPQNVGALGIDIDLERHNEGAEPTSPQPVAIHDQPGISGKVDVYSRQFLITLQALHADASRKIVDTARNAGAAAGRLRAQLVYGLLESNATLGDGGQMFHSDYGNLLTGAALSLESIQEMDSALCRIETTAGNPVATKAKYLAVAPEQRVAAVNILHNAGLSDIEVVPSPELADAGNYYLCADPAINPPVALMHLEGREDGLAMIPGERKREFGSRGVALDLVYDVGVVPVSRLGVVRRPSA